MRAVIAAAACAALCVCARAQVQPKPLDAPPGVPAAQMNAPAAPIVDTSGPISKFVSGMIACTGHATEGGFMVCQTQAGARVTVRGGGAADKAESDQQVIADAKGYALIGFDRDAKGAAHIEAKGAGFDNTLDIPISARTFEVQRVNGLPPQTVTPTDPAIIARIGREWQLKQAALASDAQGDAFAETWVWPVKGRISGLWGNQRIDNGVPKTPHYGVDIAGPVGTQIRAPADGVVVLAQPDMFYEGGLVFVDHGQGLVSMYLHMSRVDVKVGDHLKQGDPIGARGALGRATGPHLCWRLKWRDRYLDPSLTPLTPVEPLEAGPS